MPFTLEQLDFLSVHVGVAIPPDFLENKRRAEQYKQRSAEMAARAEEIKQRRDAAALEGLLKQATGAATGKNFAQALELLDQLESTLAIPEAPEPEPQPEPAKTEPQPQGNAGPPKTVLSSSCRCPASSGSRPAIRSKPN